MELYKIMNISDEQIKKIFELASMEQKMSLDEVSSKDISEALIAIERKIYSFSSEVKSEGMEKKKILIADDLELSIYQLSTLLKKIGIEPSVARTKEEAISELQKVHFDCVIIDLFLPDSADGFALIKTVVDKRINTNGNFSIVVISGTDDTSMTDACYAMGADFYIQKDQDWHSKLLKFLTSTFQSDNSTAFSKSVINNNIASYHIKKLNEVKVFEELKKSVNSGIYNGLNKVIFDLSDIVTFDVENAYIFAEIYKICAENNGKFIFVNPSNSIQDAMEFAYLTDVIPFYPSVDDAVKSL